MPDQVVLFGLNHETAPVDLRERWAFSPQEAIDVLQRAQDSLGESEGVILSTCNRTEVYTRVPGGAREEPDLGPIFDYFCESKSCTRAVIEPHLYIRHDRDAIQHLFRLAGGLNSMVLGESQILRQIRDAFDLACKAGSVGRFFHRLFPAALKTGRRIRSDTSLGEGCITMGQAAVRIALRHLASIDQGKFMIVGSGEIARLTAMAFKEHTLKDFFVVNRSPENAQKIVESLGGEARGLGDLYALLDEVDVVISSTGSQEPLVRREHLESFSRDGRPLVIIDLAVPRDFDPAIGSLHEVHLYNIDHIRDFVEENINSRRAEIPHAENIVQKELRTFLSQMNWTNLDPVIRHLIERFDALRAEELERVLTNFPEELHDTIERFSQNLMKKFIHFPVEKLKSLRDDDGLTPTEIAFLKRLFLTHGQQTRPPDECDDGSHRHSR